MGDISLLKVWAVARFIYAAAGFLSRVIEWGIIIYAIISYFDSLFEYAADANNMDACDAHRKIITGSWSDRATGDDFR